MHRFEQQQQIFITQTQPPDTTSNMQPLPKPIGFGRPKPAVSAPSQNSSRCPIILRNPKELMESSVAEPQIRPAFSSCPELNNMLHNDLLLLKLYSDGYPEPESHSDLRTASRRQPLEFYRAFCSNEELKVLTVLEILDKNLLKIKMQRQEEEIVYLRRELLRGTPGYHHKVNSKNASTFVSDIGDEHLFSAFEAIREETIKVELVDLLDHAVETVRYNLKQVEELVDDDPEQERVTTMFFNTTPNTRSVFPKPSASMEWLWGQLGTNSSSATSTSLSGGVALPAPSITSQSSPATSSSVSAGAAVPISSTTDESPARYRIPEPHSALQTATESTPPPCVSSNEADMSGFSFPADHTVNRSSIYGKQNPSASTHVIPANLPPRTPRGPKQWVAEQNALETEAMVQRGVQQWLLAQHALQSRISRG